MALPIAPALPALAGLRASMERQRTALQEGSADDLHDFDAQIRLQVAQIRQARTQGQPGALDEQAREEVRQLNELASTNLALLQRRLVEAQSALAALGVGVPALQESQSRTTYQAAGRMGSIARPGREIGRA